MGLGRIARVAAVLALCLPWAAQARGGARLGVGGDYWLTERALFHLTLAVEKPFGRHFGVGGRFGVFATSGPTLVGVPLDLSLRAYLGGERVYLEGLLGPWVLFAQAPLRAHGALGFGMQSGSVSVGLEVGWLDPAAMLGLRFAFQL